MKTARTRAAEGKRARRRQLLEAAADCLDRHGYGATTMARVAERAGLAKGTTYLYFRSKEELFLELLLGTLAEWGSVASAEVAEAAAAGGPDEMARLLARGVAARPRLVALLALRAAVLEPGASGAARAEFVRRRREFLEPLAAALEARLPALGAGGGRALLDWTLALAAGLARGAGGAPSDPELERGLATCVAALLRGALTWPARGGLPPVG